MQRPEQSLVNPVFNEEALIPELRARLTNFLAKVEATWEVVFVDDGSSDRSRALLAAECQKESRFKLVALSRNFGHQLAITAGVDFLLAVPLVVHRGHGQADLQDPPEVVGEMLTRYREGYEVVYGVRLRREERRRGSSGERRLSSIACSARWSACRFRSTRVTFELMSRRVVIALASLRETHRFVRGMVAWVGFRQTAVYYDRPARFAGETHYPMRKMLRFAVDGITSFSAFPLKLATYLGALAGVIGFGTATWALWEKLTGGFTVPGWTTIMVAVCFAASAQLLMTGILGEYVGRIYDEVNKRRPLYLIVSEAFNVESEREEDAPRSYTEEPRARRRVHTSPVGDEVPGEVLPIAARAGGQGREPHKITPSLRARLSARLERRRRCLRSRR